MSKVLFNSLKATTLAAALVLTTGSFVLAKTVPLKGLLANERLWSDYKHRFLDKSGRIIDNANKNISHSEGQGFSMLMAVAANDRKAFDSIWKFTKDNMMVRRDNLVAWRWSPRGFKRVTDKNNATDGDIMIAWALLEAHEAGFSDNYRRSALEILRDVKKLLRNDKYFGTFMLPGAKWFTGEHNKGKDIINLSYWVFPALERLAVLTGDATWTKVAASGEKLIWSASNNRAGLPPDWSGLRRHKGEVEFAPKFSKEFSYNAIRVPLYLAWSSQNRSTSLNRFHKNWISREGGLSQVDVRWNRTKGAFQEQGYHAVAAVVNCSLAGSAFPQNLRTTLDKNYYPASLHLLSIIATKQRYPQCW